MAAKPILKIKTGSSKPDDFNSTLNGSTVVSTTGLTAGELGAVVTPPNYAFYIGNNSGKAITFGAEISIDDTLGGNSSSDYKLPSQKALKTYIDQSIGGPGSSEVKITSRYLTDDITVSSNLQKIIPFDTEDFTVNGGVDELTYTPGAGTFFNYNPNSLNLLIIYQITWSGFSSSTSSAYASPNIVKSSWIQKVGADVTNLSENRYGFKTLLLPPLQLGIAGSITGTQTGSAIINLSQDQGFWIYVQNHGNQELSVSTRGYIGDQQTVNFTKATRLQIVKL